MDVKQSNVLKRPRGRPRSVKEQVSDRVIKKPRIDQPLSQLANAPTLNQYEKGAKNSILKEMNLLKDGIEIQSAFFYVEREYPLKGDPSEPLSEKKEEKKEDKGVTGASPARWSFLSRSVARSKAQEKASSKPWNTVRARRWLLSLGLQSIKNSKTVLGEKMSEGDHQKRVGWIHFRLQDPKLFTDLHEMVLQNNVKFLVGKMKDPETDERKVEIKE